MEPITRKENFLAKAAGLPAEDMDPITREEWYLQKIAEGGGGGGGGESTIAWKPTVADDGTISWDRTSSTTKPADQNIKGPKGDTGDKGEKGDDGEQGVPGIPGEQGEAGVSPTVTITPITGGNRVTITDEEHPQGQFFDVMDGESGDIGKVFIAVYNSTTAQDILAYMDSQKEPFAPIIIKRGNDYYTSILSVKQADNKVLLRCVGSFSGSYYIFNYTVTDGSWTSNSQGLQNILQSGINVKTINEESVLGEGNIDIPIVTEIIRGESYLYSDLITTLQTKQTILKWDNLLIPIVGYMDELDDSDPDAPPYRVVSVYGNIQGTKEPEWGTIVPTLTVFRWKVDEDDKATVNMAPQNVSWITLTNAQWVNLKLQGKQDELVAGTNIKNVDGVSPLGSGNLTPGRFVAVPNSTTYLELSEAIYANKQILIKVENGPLNGYLTAVANIDFGGEFIVLSSENGVDDERVMYRVVAETNEWVEDHISYSTFIQVGSEQKVGAWFEDGVTYDLYEKVVSLGPLPNGTAENPATITVDHGITDKVRFVDTKGFAYGSNNLSIPFVNANGSLFIYMGVGNTKITITANSDRSGLNGYAYLKFIRNRS